MCCTNLQLRLALERKPLYWPISYKSLQRTRRCVASFVVAGAAARTQGEAR